MTTEPKIRRWTTTVTVLTASVAVALLLAGCFADDGDPLVPGKKGGPFDNLLPQEQSSERPAAAAPAKAPAGKAEVVFDNGNTLGIRPGGAAPTFALAKAATITSISDYHYIVGGGPTPGTIGLKGADGTVYGPWPCKGTDGQGGVKNAYWIATPNAAIPAGAYTVMDSDPSTWSTDDMAGGMGFVTVTAIYK